MAFPKPNYDPTTKIFSAPPEDFIYDVNCSIGKIILHRIKCLPNYVFQISDIDGKVVTGKEWYTWSVRLAQRFKKMQLTHEDIIGICADQSTYIGSLISACLMNCTPFHAVPPGFDEETTRHVLNQSKPKLVFCDGKYYQTVLKATSHFKPIIYTITEHIDGVPKIEDLFEPTSTEMFYKAESLKLGCDQTVALLCSSGTTGLPKSVCISNRYFFDSGEFVTSQDVLFSFSGIHWLTGASQVIQSLMNGLKRVITNKPFSGENFVGIVKDHKVTCVTLSNRYASALLNCPLATSSNLQTIKYFLVVGGCLSLTHALKLKQMLPHVIFMDAYGLTETKVVSAKIGDFNALIPGVSVRIISSDGENLGPNKEGEIVVHTGRKWLGYYGNKKETQKIMTNDGWIHTGDLGYFDDNFTLHVVDRQKDVLKHEDYHYSPTEIEKVIVQHTDIVDACVFGIRDDLLGDVPAALVVRKEGSTLTEQDVKDHVANRFETRLKRLKAGVKFVESIPVNVNGKADKKKAIALFTA